MANLYPLSADFDGTNDYMLRGAGLTGASDGSQGILSFWMRIDGGDATTRHILRSVTAWVFIRISSGNTIQVSVQNITSSFVFRTVGTYTAGTDWHHVYISWDTNFSAGNKLAVIKVDGVSDVTVVSDTNAAFSVDYTETEWAIGSNTDGANKFNGCFAEFYFNIAAYSTDETKFRDAGGIPIDIGANGSNPTGAQPIVYQSVRSGGVASDFATNRGSGGNFSITGSLDLCSTNPAVAPSASIRQMMTMGIG